MIAIELKAAIDASGTLQTFYIADDQLVTLPTDTPANIAFEPALGGLTFSTSVFKNGQTSGESSKTGGEILIVNPDGYFDNWVDYGFDGRAFTIRSGSGAYPSNFPILFTGTIETFQADFKQISLKTRDAEFVFSKQLSSNLYLGNNALPNGLEGVADIKGKPKPKLYGSVYNVAPILVNSSKLTYQVNDGAINSILVKDRGVNLTFQSDYATSALLQAAAVNAASYSTCLAEGYFRLGSTPAGKVTANVVQGATSAARSVSAILQAMATAAGVLSLDAPAIAATQAAAPAIVGIYITDTASFASAMDQLAGSVGAYYGFNPDASFTMGVLTIPSGTPVITFNDYEFQSIARRAAKDNGLPVYSVTVKYNKNYSVFGNDVAGAAGIVESANLSQDYNNQTAIDNTVKNQFLLADTIEKDTLLTTAIDATNEATRLLNIYKVRRDIFEITLNISALPTVPLKLMDVVNLVYSRYGMGGGRLFRLLGLDFNLRSKTVVLTLWG